jgi:putative cardiolipin synthase
VQAFAELIKRDVTVTILTNSLAANDVPLVHTGYARYRVDLLRTGVDLYELGPTHAPQRGASRSRNVAWPHAVHAPSEQRFRLIGPRIAAWIKNRLHREYACHNIKL